MEKSALIFFILFGILLLIEGVWFCFIKKDPRRSYFIVIFAAIQKMSREDAKKQVRVYFKYIAGIAVTIILSSLIAYFMCD